MRTLLLGLNIVIGVSIVTLPSDVTAATLSKSSQNKSKKLNRAQTKNKIAAGPSDLWERIRTGMKIPHPVVAQNMAQPLEKNLSAKAAEMSLPNSDDVEIKSVGIEADQQSVDSKPSPESNLIIRPYKAIPPANRYTELGERLLGSKSHKAKIIDCSAPVVRQGNTTRNKAEIAQINERIKASMASHAQDRKHTVILVASSQNNANSGLTNHQIPTNDSEQEQGEAVDLIKPNRISNPCAQHPDSKSTLVRSNDQQGMVIGLAENQINIRQSLIEERINKHIAGYSQNPGFLYSVAQRAQPYLYHIVESLSKQGMPLELALLPIVESAYQPTAQSPKKAAGLWQFVPMTGKDFNLEQTSDYDERLDVPESTQAAIRFLSGLKDHFKGDWLLALAAYNAGQGTVDNAIGKNQAEGLPTDFWSLRLPEETQNYVPRLLALSKIFSRPGAYGIKLTPIRNEPYFIEVKLGREFDVNYLTQKDIDSIAQLASLTPEQFSILNPGYLNNALPKNDSYKFLMPEHNAKLLKDRLLSIEKFVSAPTEINNESLKSLVLKEDSKQNLEFPGSTMSLISDLMANKSSESPIFPIPLISLNVENRATTPQSVQLTNL